MIITNSDTVLIPNFQEKEFYGTSANGSHFLADALVQAVSLIRATYKQPVTITSTYRSPEYNKLIGGSEQSQHIKGKAIDFKLKSIESLIRDIENKGEVFTYLRNIGINGFGLYDNFIHLDTRDQESDVYNSSDEKGLYSIWDNRKKKVNRLIPSSDLEDGYLDYKNHFKASSLILVLFIIIAILIIIKYRK